MYKITHNQQLNFKQYKCYNVENEYHSVIRYLVFISTGELMKNWDIRTLMGIEFKEESWLLR